MLKLGNHGIVEVKFFKADVEHLRDPYLFKGALENAIHAVGATLLNCHIHRFGEAGGFTMNMSLSESHATIHTWPEYEVATMDIYMCGDCDPRKAFYKFFRELSAEHVEPDYKQELYLDRGLMMGEQK